MEQSLGLVGLILLAASAIADWTINLRRQHSSSLSRAVPWALAGAAVVLFVAAIAAQSTVAPPRSVAPRVSRAEPPAIASLPIEHAAAIATRWRIEEDMNGDGRITISDVRGWIAFAFFAPGDALLSGLLHAPRVAEFLEITPAWFGGWASGFASFCLWVACLTVGSGIASVGAMRVVAGLGALISATAVAGVWLWMLTG